MAEAGTLVGFMMADVPEEQLLADVSPKGCCKSHLMP